MENIEYKFQILFVFGQSYMSKDAAKNLTKEWQLENKEHHDLIIAGMLKSLASIRRTLTKAFLFFPHQNPQ